MAVERSTRIGATRNGHDPVWGSGGGTGPGTPGAASPMLLDLDGWGVDQALWLPGATGNFASVPDTNVAKSTTSVFSGGSAGGWMAGANTTASVSTDQSVFGGHSIAFSRSTGTGAGDIDVATTFNNQSLVPAAPGDTITVSASVRAAVTRDIAVQAMAMDGGTTLAIWTGANVSVAAGTWGRGHVTTPALPTGTTHLRLRVYVRSADEADGTYHLDAVCARHDGATTFLPSHRIVGDVDLRARVSPKDWTPGALFKPVDRLGGGTTGFDWWVDTAGKLNLRWHDGSSLLSAKSTVAVGATDRTPKWVRATLDVNNGAGGHDVKFYTSPDGVAWTQLGATITTAGATQVAGGPSRLTFGADANGNNVLLGACLHAEARDGIDGPVVASAEFSDPAVVTGDVSTTAEGHTLTINRSGDATAELVDRNTLAFTGAEHLEVPHRAGLDIADGESFTLALGMNTRSGVSSRWFGKRRLTGASPFPGYLLLSDVGGARPRFYIEDIAGAIEDTGSGPTPVVNDAEWHVMSGEADADSVHLYLDAVELGTQASTVGSLENVASMVLGSEAGTARGLVTWAALFRRILTSAERTELANWDAAVASEPGWLRDAATFYWHAADTAASTGYRLRNEVVNLAGDPFAPIPPPHQGPERIRHLGHTSVAIPT